MKKLGKEVTDLKQSSEFTENNLEEKVNQLDEKHVNLENQCNELYNNSLESKYFFNKLVDLEDRSRRKILRINGIAEESDESWKQCEGQLQKNKCFYNLTNSLTVKTINKDGSECNTRNAVF